MNKIKDFLVFLKKLIRKKRIDDLKYKKCFIYTNTLENKYKQLIYCIEKISEFKGILSVDDPGFYIDFYTDTYFMIAYSILEVLAGLVNEFYFFISKERQVSFFKLCEKLKDYPKNEVLKYFDRFITSEDWFDDLKKYRKCVSHRRSFDIEDVLMSSRPGYTATGYSTIEKRFLPKDPLSWHHSIDRNKEVSDYLLNLAGLLKRRLEGTLRILKEEASKKKFIKGNLSKQ